MTPAMELAQRYFQLSNAGDLDAIEALFTEASTYSSTQTGVYLGADQIIAMQRRFFAGFKTLAWEIRTAKEIRPGVVFFEFDFSGKTVDGETVQRSGEEYVVVHDGRLQHVEVR